MEAIETTEIKVPLRHLKDAVEMLTVEDVFFFVMPYPGDKYVIGVRTCEADRVLPNVANMIALNG